MKFRFDRCERCGQVSSDLTEDGLCPLCDFVMKSRPVPSCAWAADFAFKSILQKDTSWIGETISRVNEENKSLW
jgi:hypothetical protein